MSNRVWFRLMNELSKRGGAVRESGAFLLGHMFRGRREVIDFIAYDDLEPGCLDAGWINFSSVGYRRLWTVLKETALDVVGDIHTHPGAPFQSDIDIQNPMMPSAGHVAIIVANYALGNPHPKDVSLYIYQGGEAWTEFRPGASDNKIYIGIWS
jgi:proteasome lid subunit RPN8/RPN11